MICLASRPILFSLILAVAVAPRVAAAQPEAPPTPGEPAPPPSSEPAPPPDPDALDPAAQAEFDVKVLSVEEEVHFTAPDGHTEETSGGGLFVGQEHRQIETDEFLRLAGRSDRVRAIKGRRRTRLIMLATGGVFVIGGVAYGAGGVRCDLPPSNPGYRDCQDRHHLALELGLGAAAVGAGIAIWGGLLSTKEPSNGELRQIADDYDKDLRARLKSHGASKPPPVTSMLILSPVIGTDGGGLVLSGSF